MTADGNDAAGIHPAPADTVGAGWYPAALEEHYRVLSTGAIGPDKLAAFDRAMERTAVVLKIGVKGAEPAWYAIAGTDLEHLAGGDDITLRLYGHGPDGAEVTLWLTDVTALELPPRCACEGWTTCAWNERAGRKVSVCLDCGGDR